MNKQTKADATEFGVHYKKGGWRLGLLVARNVNVAKAGRPPKVIITGNNYDPEKTTGKAFAQAAGVSQTTIVFHLSAWNLAASNGLVDASNTLSIGDNCPLPDDAAEWSRYYQMARIPAKPRKGKGKPKEEEPAPARTRPATPGAVIIGRMNDVAQMRAANPEDNDTQIGKALSVSHQEVGRMRWLAEGPPRLREQVASDRLKWSVAQEILQAPLLDPNEMAGLADLFVDGTLPQTGQAKTTARPLVLLAQRLTPKARARFLAGELSVADAQATLEAKPPKADKPHMATSPMLYADNLRKRVDSHLRAAESFTDGLVQSEGMIDTVRAIDPVTCAHIAKDLNRLRLELWRQYQMLGGWVEGLGGVPEDPAGGPHLVVIDGR
jgi:hypothetical protein